MYYKNMIFKFNVDNDIKVVPLKTIKNVKRAHDGIVRIRTNDCVMFTISMEDKAIPILLDYYNEWLWEVDNSVKDVEFPTYSLVGRLDIDGGI